MKKFLKSLLALLMSALIIFGASIPAFASENNYKYGVDISYHNGDFDFSSSAFAGKSFVMIRLGYYNHIDTEFWNNVKKATAANIDFGVYLYSYAYSSAEVKVESDFAIKTLSQLTDEQRQHFTLPLAYDLEDKKLAENLGYSKSKITAQAVQFCDAVKNVGYVPMIYANQNWFTNYIDLNTVTSKKYKIWFAYYTPKPDFSKPKTIGTTGVAADIWQYAEKSGDISCDQNVLYNPSELIKPLCIHSFKQYVTRATATANGKIVTKCQKCGKVSSTKAINKASNIKLSRTWYTYNGKVQTPSVTVKDSKGNTLKKGTHYTLSYQSGRKSVGRYYIKVNFKGNYSGSKTLYYDIVPKSTSVSKVTAGKKSFKVTWKKQASQTTGYQIQYSTHSNFKNAKSVWAKSKVTSKSVTKLSAKKNYYVRVRTYKTIKFGGKNHYLYSTWSGSKKIKTK
mgnify:FL=1